MLVFAFGGGGLVLSPAVRGPDPVDLTTLIGQVGSNRFAEREAATRRLIEIEAARAEVERLSQSGDPEIAERAKRIIVEQDRLYARTRLTRYLDYGRDGQIERMVEGLTQWQGPIDNKELWNDLQAIAVMIVGKLEQDEKRYVSLQDFLQVCKQAKREPILTRARDGWDGRLANGGYLLSASEIHSPGLGNATVVSEAGLCLVAESAARSCSQTAILNRARTGTPTSPIA